MEPDEFAQGSGTGRVEPWSSSSRAIDPWQHEHGEDPDHHLTAEGHCLHQRHEEFAHLLGTPQPVAHRGAGLRLHRWSRHHAS